VGIAIAQQMVGTMNHVLRDSVISGSIQANRSADRQQFYVAMDSAIGGPWSRQQVQAEMLSGRLARDSWVWTPGMPQWARMGDVTYFSEIPVLPPPLPSRGTEP
jgi:hypothetical protein